MVHRRELPLHRRLELFLVLVRHSNVWRLVPLFLRLQSNGFYPEFLTCIGLYLSRSPDGGLSIPKVIVLLSLRCENLDVIILRGRTLDLIRVLIELRMEFDRFLLDLFLLFFLDLLHWLPLYLKRTELALSHLNHGLRLKFFPLGLDKAFSYAWSGVNLLWKLHLLGCSLKIGLTVLELG